MTAAAFNAVLALFLLWLLVRAKADGLRALRWLGRKWPHFDIMKNGLIYLRRYFIAEIRRLFAIFLHNIRHEDDDRDPHDHPRSFVTIVLWGGYTDESWHVPGGGHCGDRGGVLQPFPCASEDKLRVGSIRFRKAEHVHRVRDVLPNTWTLTIWGPYRRDWGFWTPQGWEHWREYLGIEGDYAAD